MRIRLAALLFFVAAIISPVSWAGSGHSSDKDLGKVAAWVLDHTRAGQQTEFLVVLGEQADLSGADALTNKDEKAAYVYRALWEKAQATQDPLLHWLRANHIEHRSFYIINCVWVKGDRNIALALAARPDVRSIAGNPVIHNDIDLPKEQALQPYATDTIEGNITNVRAPEVWALGYTGQNVVIAGADTGYLWDHTALKNHYRGFDGASANHDYNWHDSIHSGGGICGPDSPQPCDDSGHGTHTMGTAVGDDGLGNQIGMAPGAKWIGCRNMDRGNGTPATYIECMEFFLAPYPVNGTPAQGNPALAPDITTNSWTCPPSEGCSPNTLKQAVEAQRAAGILMVVAAGNAGPSCSTVVDPPAIYDASFSVGAYNHSTNAIASFSSRGPVTIDGSNRMKPNIAAPGVSVRSSWTSSVVSYNTISGTSMATPHVAGAAALLWSAQPSIKNNVSFTIQILNDAAVHVPLTLCSSSGSPNNVYGFGRLDVKAAVDAALPCTSAPALSQTSAAFHANAGTGMVNVTSVAGCAWVAISNNPDFITVTSGDRGTGNGTVSFLVAANTTSISRSGTIAIGGVTFTVNQDTTLCLQDEASAASSVSFNAATGDYTFFCDGALIASGRGTLTLSGLSGSIEHNKGDRRVFIQWDLAAAGGKGSGSATVQLGTKTKCQITDNDLSNDTCPAPTQTAALRKEARP
ncbi:MAG TPA: S8 family serine peptidase [Blastocatellia bacterium]